MLVYFHVLDLMGLWSRTERWVLEYIGVRYDVNVNFCDINLTKFAETCLFMLLQFHADVSFIAFREVDGDVFSCNGFLIFTHAFLVILCALLVNCFYILRTRVLLAQLCIPVVRD